MNFPEFNEAHEKAQSVMEEGVTGHPVEFSQLALFDRARRHFAEGVKNNSMAPQWEEAAKLFNIIHAKLARTPCRPSWLLHELLDSRGGRGTLEKLSARIDSVDASISKSFRETMGYLETLSGIEKSPLVEEIENSLELDGTTLFVLRDMRLWEEANHCLTEAFGDGEWEIVRPSSLRTQRQTERLIIFGPTWYLEYRNEEYLLRSPVARDIHLVGCAHEFKGSVSCSLLGESQAIAITGKPMNGFQSLSADSEDHWNFEPFSPVQNGGFQLGGCGASKQWETGKKIVAIPFRLGGSHGTFLAKDSNVWVLTTDSKRSIPVCTGVEKIPVEDLEPGGLVLMTTSGGGDMIPVVADMRLKGSERIRSLQATWKGKLVAEIERQGLENVAYRLKSFGAKKATPGNIKNWCNPHPRSIAMGDLDADLPAVLRLVDMESDHAKVVSGIVALRKAHSKAGRQLLKRLRESLCNTNVSDVFRHGFMDAKDGNGPSMTIFLIERRGNEHEISEELEGQIINIENRYD
jgi:hypothetical protein